MMHLKKLLIAFWVLTPLMLFASEFPWLTFRLADSSELSVAADNLELNYKDGNLLLKSGIVNQTIPVEQIKSMRFTLLPSAIDDISVEQSAVADYFTMSGAMVGRFKTIDEARKSLPSGIYIGKSESKTYKIIF